MRNGRCSHPALLAPRPAIENSRQRGQQHITPVEMHRTLVPVRQAEQSCRQEQRRIAPYPPLQQVLQPSAKEEFFRNGDEEEGEEKCAGKLRQPRQISMEMQKTKTKPK